jgi:nicotinamidase/pyrazinamidase
MTNIKNALVIVDVQNDFIPGGALPSLLGNHVLPVANVVQKNFDLIVASVDWHPAHHGSFASQYPDKKIGDVIDLHGIPQVLWPDHCVQNTFGAEFVRGLNTDRFAKIFHKGSDPTIDSYSAFFDNEHRRATGLGDFLKEQSVTDIYILGIATDYCIKYSAIDALHLGFKVHVIEDGCSGINLKPDDSKNAIEEIRTLGVKIINSRDLDHQ